MKLKKVLASALAAAMALTTMVTTSFTASAADTEYIIFPAAYGKIEDGLILSSEACTAIAGATTSVSVSVTGTQTAGSEWCQFYLQQNEGDWACSSAEYSANGTLTINVSEVENNLFSVSSYKLNGDNINVTEVSVTVDSGSAITAWSVPNELVASSDGTLVSISAADLATYGVTADNIADCYVNVTYSSAPSAGVYGAFVMNDWGSNFAYNDSVADTSTVISFENIGDKAAAALTDGLWLQFKSSTISGIKFVVPETPTGYEVATEVAANGTVSVDKEFAAAGDTVTITAKAADGYEVDTITVTGASGNVTVTNNAFTMPAEPVRVTVTFKQTEEGETDKPGTDEPTTGGVIWEGSTDLGTDWGSNVPVSGISVNDGDKLVIYYTIGNAAEYQQLKIMDGNWTALASPVTNEWDAVELAAGTSSYEVTLNAADASALTSSGMIVAGFNVTVTKIALVKSSSDVEEPKPAPTPTPTPSVPTYKPTPSAPSVTVDKVTLEEAVDNAGDNDTVTAKISGSDSKIDAEVFLDAKEKGVKLVLTLTNSVKWIIEANDISEKAVDVDIDVDLRTKNIPAKKVEEIAGGNDTMQISLAHDGEFGFMADIQIPVAKKHNGKYANLFHYNNGDFDFIASAIVKSNKTTLPFTHASDYVIVFTDESMGEDVSSAAEIHSDSNAVFGAESNSVDVKVLAVVFAALAFVGFAASRKIRQK